MRTISAMDLRRKTGEWLDRASAGERIVIERDRRPLAVLIPYEEAVRLDASPDEILRRRRAALRRLDAFSRRMAALHPSWPGDETAEQTIRWERDHGHGDHG
jgi:prevent-host-death family protein